MHSANLLKLSDNKYLLESDGKYKEFSTKPNHHDIDNYFNNISNEKNSINK